MRIRLMPEIEVFNDVIKLQIWNITNILTKLNMYEK